MSLGSDPGDLRARLRAGDPDALAELLDRHWTPLVRFLTPLLGDPDAADDAAQDAFARLWQARGRLEERGSLEALLFQIARNGARDRGLPDRAGPLRAGWPPVRIER